MSDIELTSAEQKVYDRVCQGDIMCKDLTPWESGAVPSLVQKGLVEIYKLNVSTSRVRMLKFMRLKT
ncbi:MAG: hypothetical protein NWF07_09975 [Candidatus Bathyarchaeota archaeon]|nr:hypothetical protein [Candidatus Bathyarchaeota archaeon]